MVQIHFLSLESKPRFDDIWFIKSKDERQEGVKGGDVITGTKGGDVATETYTKESAPISIWIQWIENKSKGKD